MANQPPAVVVIRVTTSTKIVTTPSALTVIKSGIIRECVPKTPSVVSARRRATWPSIARILGIAVPRLLGLCLRRILKILFPPPVERPAQPAETQDTSVPQADLADPTSQPGSSDLRVLDSQGTLISMDSAAAEPPAVPSPSVSAPLFSGDQPSPTPASAVPSVSDSVLGQIPSVPEDPEPSVTDSALAEVDIPLVSLDPVPSVTDSALAEVDIPPASLDPVPSVSDSLLAQVDVPSPSDVPALDLTQPDENSDDDEMGDSAAPLETEKLTTAWKRVSRKKDQRRKNLARKATTSHSFAPVRKATRPKPPGVRPNRGKDPPE